MLLLKVALALNGQIITDLSVEKRAQAGLFLAFQHPYEIPGVTVYNFLKEAILQFIRK